MLTMKKRSHVSISINDYIVRALVSKGQKLEQPVIYELPLPKGVVQDGAVVDELTLFEIVKSNVAKWGGKKQNVRLFVPDTSVLLKTFDHPAQLTGKALKEYVQMEIGQSIHLPFQEPLLDVYDHQEGDGQAVLFAAPPDEVTKLIGLLLDCHLQPQVADIRALCNLRLLEHINLLDSHKTYLITDWSINELSICIYSKGNVEFLRFQSIETNLENWQDHMATEGDVTFTYNGELDDYRAMITDQVLEIDRMMNFFKFSLHKGEKSVDEIVVLGDNPLLQSIADFLSENLVTPVKLVDDSVVSQRFPNCKAKHASLLGLALKGVNE
ncbi:type IV pilus biogenesis protein PilM [Lysinibacillus sp. 54212]|uniref:type IV pilus biogenesis protein PilM n=1 Tax=Lysinibacillus sp. 54212 TaxID=3119829 RepID=UPI002FC83120